MIVSEWSVDRGRSYELDKNAPGTATIKIIDIEGTLDPTNLAFDFGPGTPGAIALHNPVTDTDHTVFYGHVARFSYDVYQNNQYAVATVELVDGLERLAKTEMYPGEGAIIWGDGWPARNRHEGDILFDEDDQVSHRLHQILNEADWPLGLREIFSGNVRLQETKYAPRTPALTAILDAVDAEFPGVANAYIQMHPTPGAFTFHGRLARFIPADVQYHIRTWLAGDTQAVAEDAFERAIIFELGYEQDVNKIINSAIATPMGIRNVDIAGQRVEDLASIAEHGYRSVSFENLITLEDHFDSADANEAVKRIAEFYVSNFSQPVTRVNRITFKRLPPDSPYAERLWELICGVDISDIIQLNTYHFTDGGFVEQEFYVEGLHYRARPLAEDYLDVELTLDVSPRDIYGENPWT